MTSALIHIGAPKTATTTIQRFLRKNFAALGRLGFSVPMMWGVNDNALQVLSYHEDRWDESCSLHARRFGYGGKRLNLSQWRNVRRRLDRELHHFVQSNRESTLLFSAEGLYARLAAEDVAQLKSTLISRGIEAQVVVYVREPLSARLSTAGQYIKMGWHVELGEILSPLSPLQRHPHSTWVGAEEYDTIPRESYIEKLQAWEEIFPEQVRVRLYDPLRFGSMGILGDYCRELGIDPIDGFTLPDQENVGLPWPVIRVLNEVNTHVNRRALLADGSVNPHRLLPPSELNSWNLTPNKPYISAQDAWAFRSHFVPLNEELRARYFPDQERLWSEPQGFTEGAGDFDTPLTDGECAFAEILIEMGKAVTKTSARQKKFLGLSRNLQGVRNTLKGGKDIVIAKSLDARN